MLVPFLYLVIFPDNFFYMISYCIDRCFLYKAAQRCIGVTRKPISLAQ